MAGRVIYETEHFNVLLPERPHIPREDGGHIYITSKEHYTDRTEFPEEIACEMVLLSQKVGRAFIRAMADGGVTVSRINYQENGNWAFRNGGSYAPYFHLHIYGRTVDSKTQAWGEALYFPDPDTGFYDHFEGLTEADVEALIRYLA